MGRELRKLRKLKLASAEMRKTTTKKKNAVLLKLSDLLVQNVGKILQENEVDLKHCDSKKSLAFRDRLMLDRSRVENMAEGLEELARFEDPVGKVIEVRKLRNGLELRKTMSPIGVVFLIFESRPNVAIESFSLAFKSGNTVILRGGKESRRTSELLYSLIRMALQKSDFSEDCFWGISNPDRSLVSLLLGERKWIDLVIPRGGNALIDFVCSKSKIPIIKNDRGLCHIYVHEDSDLKMAEAIVINAKTQRPGVCNAMETLLVHKKVASEFLPSLEAEMKKFNLKWHACPASKKLLRSSNVAKAREKDWDTEYLALEMNCKVVSSMGDALEHISRHGSGHSEAIVCRSKNVAREFQNSIDAAVVYWNASTRFTDGFEFGLGGEIGISTQKLHVRGPVGLRDLTCSRWVVDGLGQVRAGK